MDEILGRHDADGPDQKSGTCFDLGHLYAVPQVFDDGNTVGNDDVDDGDGDDDDDDDDDDDGVGAGAGAGGGGGK